MLATAKRIIPIRALDEDRYGQPRLLADGSVVAESARLAALLRELENEPEITRLLHPEVRYEVTDNCNATCIMCPRDKHEHGREHGIMDQAKYERSIDEVVQLGAKKIVLTGFGEPMLDKRLEDKIAYAHGKGLSTYFITNGSALTPRRSRKLMESGLSEMRVSFYGMRPETYNAVMQGLDFHRTMKGVLEFLRIRGELGSNTRVQISYLELPENKSDTDAFREFWVPRVNAVEIWKPHNFGDGRDYRARSEAQDDLRTPRERPVPDPVERGGDTLLLRLQQSHRARQRLRAGRPRTTQQPEIPAAAVRPSRERVWHVPLLRPVRSASPACRRADLYEPPQPATRKKRSSYPIPTCTIWWTAESSRTSA